MKWETRITGYGEEPPDQLLANPRNWRIHPKGQQDALEDVLNRVGFVRDVIVNKTTGHVVDGHLRVGLAISRNESKVPVTYVELTEVEERTMLAALDPIAGLAEADAEAYERLAKALGKDGDPTVANLLEDLHASPEEPWRGQNAASLNGEVEVICPGCGWEGTWSKEKGLG